MTLKGKRAAMRPKEKRERSNLQNAVGLPILEDLRENAGSSGCFRLFQKMSYVLFYRVLAYTQMPGDFFIGPPLTDVFHNFHFPIR